MDVSVEDSIMVAGTTPLCIDAHNQKPIVEGNARCAPDGDQTKLVTPEPKLTPLENPLPMDSESDVQLTNHNGNIILHFTDPAMTDGLLYRLNTFRRNRELCDVVIFVSGKEIIAHKVVLAACSSSLYDMFIRNDDETAGRRSASNSPPVRSSVGSVAAILPPLSPTTSALSYYEFSQFDYDCFNAIVHYAYTSSLEISSRKVGELYKTANALQIQSVADVCARYLIQHLNVMNCIDIRKQANINDDVLVEKVNAYIAANFAEIVNDSHQFTLLTCIKLHLIVDFGNTKWSCSGEFLAQRALKYFQAMPNSKDRTDQWIAQLAEKTHLLYMGSDEILHDCSEVEDSSPVGSSDIIQDYKKTGGFLPRNYSGILDPAHHISGAKSVNLDLNIGKVVNNLSSIESLNSAGSSSSEPDDEPCKLIAVQQTAGQFWIALAVIHRRLVSLSFQLSDAEHVIKMDKRLIANPNESETKVLLLDLLEEENDDDRMDSSILSLHKPLAHMNSARCSIGAVFSAGKIIVCGGYDRGECLKSVEEYDVIEGCWKRLPEMNSIRGRLDAAVVGSKVYAVAGSSGSVDLKSVECFDLETQKWTSVKSLMQGRSHNGCATLDGFIYCIGGMSDQEVLNECEMYDPKVNEWACIASLHNGRSQAGCTSWRGFVVVCGGCDRWRCFDSVEIYDPKTNIWKTIAPLKTPRRGCAVAAVGDTLYVIGGHDGTQSLASVEILDNPTGHWRTGPSLTAPRANVRAVVTTDGDIYLLGGFDGIEFLSTIELLNKESLGWRT